MVAVDKTVPVFFVADTRRSIEWYTRVLGFRLLLKDHAYGMREATVRDPDGNDLYIGQPITGP